MGSTIRSATMEKWSISERNPVFPVGVGEGVCVSCGVEEEGEVNEERFESKFCSIENL